MADAVTADLADPTSLPAWRRRPPRVIPDGFVPPRARRRAGDDAEPGAAMRVPFNRVRARAALALVASKRTSAHAHTLVRCDYSAVTAARQLWRSRFAATEGFALTYLPFVAAAVCRALRSFPKLNATTDPGGEALVVHRRIVLGIAVDLDHDGLVVPLVPDADGLTVRGLARAIDDVAHRARARQLRPDDVRGGTFTITNPGGHGTHWSFPIINQPQVAILSTDGIRKQVVSDADGRLVIRPVGYLCLTFDHRMLDGAYAARFLDRIRTDLETTGWEAML